MRGSRLARAGDRRSNRGPSRWMRQKLAGWPSLRISTVEAAHRRTYLFLKVLPLTFPRSGLTFRLAALCSAVFAGVVAVHGSAAETRVQDEQTLTAKLFSGETGEKTFKVIGLAPPEAEEGHFDVTAWLRRIPCPGEYAFQSVLENDERGRTAETEISLFVDSVAGKPRRAVCGRGIPKTAGMEKVFFRLGDRENPILETVDAHRGVAGGPFSVGLFWSRLPLSCSLAIPYIAKFRWLGRRLVYRGTVTFQAAETVTHADETCTDE